MRILVAEDEKDLNRLLSTRLKAEHYSVDSCFDGQEALDYLEGAPYDAVVLDIMMPVLDGLSVLTVSYTHLQRRCPEKFQQIWF